MFVCFILVIFINMSTTQPSQKIPTSSSRCNLEQISQKIHQLERNANEAIRRLPVVLNEQQIKRLKEHKYATEGKTLLDPYMEEYWKWLVEYCPLWIAPNLLTIIGLVLHIGTTVLLMILTDGGKEQVNKHFFAFLQDKI